MLLSITRVPIGSDLDPGERLSVGAWQVFAAADDTLTRVSRTNHSIALFRSPLNVLALPPDGIGSSIRLDCEGRRLTLTRSFGAGAALYYTITRGGDILCSTTIATLKRLGVQLEEDRARLAELLVYSYVCPPATLFKSIYALAPGDQLVFTSVADEWRLCQRSVFELPILRPAASAFDSDVAVALAKAAAVVGPVQSGTTVLLSGGLDSSILCHLAVRQGYNQPTLGTSYPFERESADIEKPYATTAADALGVHHDHYVPHAQRYLAGLIEAIAAAEAPLHGLQTVLLGCLCRDRVPEGPTIIINGEGADSVFGTASQKEAFDAGTPSRLERLLSGDILDAVLWRVRTRISMRLFEGTARRRHIARRLDDPNYFLWMQARFGDVGWACSQFGVKPHACWTTRQAVQAQYSQEQLPEQTLLLAILGGMNASQTSWSRVAEVTGRTMYYPFTHPDVMNVGMSIPWEQRVPIPKYQLKRAARAMGLADFIVDRPKAHFGVAADRWAARGGVFEPLVRLAAPVVGEDTIRQVQVPKESLARVYWNLLNYAIWHRLVIAGDTVDQLIGELQEAIAENAATPAPQSS